MTWLTPCLRASARKGFTRSVLSTAMAAATEGRLDPGRTRAKWQRIWGVSNPPCRLRKFSRIWQSHPAATTATCLAIGQRRGRHSKSTPDRESVSCCPYPNLLIGRSPERYPKSRPRKFRRIRLSRPIFRCSGAGSPRENTMDCTRSMMIFQRGLEVFRCTGTGPNAPHV